MKIYTPQELESRYQKLPQALKDAMFSAAVSDKVYAAGLRSGLNLQQIGSTAEETALLILGLTHPKDFIKNLADRLGTDMENARALARELNSEVFAPLREAMKSTHGTDPEEDMRLDAPAAAHPPPPASSREDRAPWVRPPSPPRQPPPPPPQVQKPTPVPPLPPPPPPQRESKIPPIDLRQQPRPGQTETPSSPRSAPPPRPKGYDPYREPAE